MNSPLPVVTVIIPTLALSERREQLQRAVGSVLGQTGVVAMPIVVVNGPRVDRESVAALRVNPRVNITTREEPNLPGAIIAGRRLVNTPWFTVLDDDDFLLPGALALRVQTLIENPRLEFVVTNGYRRSPAGDQLHVTEAGPIRENPLRALLERNWLLQGSWLGRSQALEEAQLKEMPRYLECTFLAARFASGGRMRYLDTPTVVWYQDTPDSLSKSEAFHLGEVSALQAIRRLPVPRWFRRGIDRKIGDACHTLADEFRESGRLAEAWRWHLRSLGHWGGLRYLISTRHFLTTTLQS